MEKDDSSESKVNDMHPKSLLETASESKKTHSRIVFEEFTI